MCVILFILQPLSIASVILSINARDITITCLLLRSVKFWITAISSSTASAWAVFTTFNFARRPSFSRLGVLISQIKTAGYLCNITLTKMQSTERGLYIWRGRRSSVHDTIAEVAVTHISYVNKSNRLYKQHHRDKNAINWTWVYIFGKVGAVLWQKGTNERGMYFCLGFDHPALCLPVSTRGGQRLPN